MPLASCSLSRFVSQFTRSPPPAFLAEPVVLAQPWWSAFSSLNAVASWIREPCTARAAPALDSAAAARVAQRAQPVEGQCAEEVLALDVPGVVVAGRGVVGVPDCRVYPAQQPAVVELEHVAGEALREVAAEADVLRAVVLLVAADSSRTSESSPRNAAWRNSSSTTFWLCSMDCCRLRSATKKVVSSVLARSIHLARHAVLADALRIR